MADRQLNFLRRRWRGLTVTILAAVVTGLAVDITAASIGSADTLTGWLLFAAVILLALFNVRKKLPFLRLGSAAAWLNTHLYVGWFSIGLFFVHVGIRLPAGPIKITVYVLFLVVALSGAFGLLISRSFAKRLTASGEEVIFERIPAYRARLQQEADALVLRSTSESGMSTLADYYTARLQPFFDGPHNFIGHLFNSRRARFALQTEIRSLTRYLDDSGRKFQEQLAALVHKKVDLDHHYALQAMLKGWLFVHIPLTYSLLIVIVVHVVLALAFSGGL